MAETESRKKAYHFHQVPIAESLTYPLEKSMSCSEGGGLVARHVLRLFHYFTLYEVRRATNLSSEQPLMPIPNPYQQAGPGEHTLNKMIDLNWLLPRGTMNSVWTRTTVCMGEPSPQALVSQAIPRQFI